MAQGSTAAAISPALVEMNLRNAQLSRTLGVALFVPDTGCVQQDYSEARQKSMVTLSLISIIEFEASVDLSLSVVMIILDCE